MWPKFLQNTSGPDPQHRLLNALLEQNALLRQLLETQGHVVPPAPRLRGSIRKATGKDVTVLTREDLLAQQIQDEMTPDERIARSSPSPHPTSESVPQ